MTGGAPLLRLALGSVLLLLFSAQHGRERSEPTGSAAPVMDAEARSAGADARWWQKVSSHIESAEYHASTHASDLQAPNRAQNFRTYFRNGGIEVVPRQSDAEGSWRFTWQTTHWGRQGRLQALERTAAPQADGSTVRYERPELIEWYDNAKLGLEQGFTVAARPPGDGPLCLVGRLGGTLRAELGDEEVVDLLDAHDTSVLRYGELHVWDTNGAEVCSRITLEGDELAIWIEDDRAVYPLTVDPLMTSPSWNAGSEQASANFGYSVAGAGDVNGDGYSDVIVGAYRYDNHASDEGRAFVYHGAANGLALSAAWTAESNQASANFGYSVASTGDVNGDGYSDVIVGAYVYDNGESNEGRAYVYHGSASGVALAAAWTAESNQVGANFGYSVASAGDVNGDGYADVIVGAHFYDNGQTNEGRAFVYHGAASGLAAAAAWTAESNQASAFFGWSVAGAGDVNSDGYSDVIVGAPYYNNVQDDDGRASVYHGTASGLAVSAAWTAMSDQGSAIFGHSVAGAGDVNGDGYSDVIIGASEYDNGQEKEGRAYVFHGSASGLTLASTWTAESDQGFAFFGVSVVSAGDVNGDGYSDVIVGAHGYDNGQSEEGRAYVYHGAASGLALSAAWIAESDQAVSFFGISVASAGDVNGDGYSDVIVGAYEYDKSFSNEGQAFVYHGAASGLALAAAWTAESNQASAQFGISVASAGDVNGDGYSDVIVGAHGHDKSFSNEGRAFVYHGAAGGLSSTANWTADGGQATALFGASVASAGDVNGDGYSDVIVGSYLYDNGEQDEGQALVYHGAASGLALSAAWTADSDQTSANFGYSVASAGDVNGDGYSDVIVGASAYDNGQTDEGRAFVYHGAASGLALAAAWTAESNQVSALLGRSVASSGDVNGDGYSDVIVGASLYDNGETDEGRALVYHGAASGLALAPAWTAESDQIAAVLGASVASAGDVNGDGYSDVIVGSPEYDNDESNEGRAFAYYGAPGGLALSAAWTGESNQGTASFGGSVSAADVNGDGYSDVIVGASRYDNGHTDEGRAFVYHGAASGLALAAAWTAESNQVDAEFGRSVASAGDVNGDGYSDVIVGAYLYTNGQNDEGRAFVYYGNGGDGLDRIPRQARTDDSAPISLLGRSNSSDGFRLKALGRTPAGRGRVRLQYEVKPFGTAFNGTGLVTGPITDTGTPGASGSRVELMPPQVTGLVANTLYHWRLRILTDSPATPRSPWLWLSGNAVTEADLRSGTVNVGVPPPPDELARFWIESASPNPFRNMTEVQYVLAARGPVRLVVYDVSGREVALLVEGVQEAGRHVARWDGRDSRGSRTAPGVYLARLAFTGRVAAEKIVRAR